MTNHLIEANSPYLLQHAHNPVDWYPWGADALERARQEDKPIFLSIGYAACHWCHVMAHESFEDENIAAVMNENFINIKVDREERPDLDSIYMSAVVAMTGQGGWPTSVFLTPEGEPFYGGTYFPPAPRFNLPSFKDVLLTIARLWGEDRERLLQSSQEIVAHLRKNQTPGNSSHPMSEDVLEIATDRLIQSYDWKNGGWGDAPKFPQPMVIEFLLQRAIQGNEQALSIARHNLDQMALGGMYDVVGGGFSRYSTDHKWLVPHFEKMLYDNAQLAQVYLHAYLITGEEFYRHVCERTLDFLVREMVDKESSEANNVPSGGLFSSLDADSEGEEGKYYLWSLSDIEEIISVAQAKESKSIEQNWFDIFINAFDVTKEGNFEGKNILRRKLSDKELAEFYNSKEDEISAEIDKMLLYLLEARNKRVRPATDDKVLVSWNSLAMVAFSEAARYLGRSDYLQVARQNADFLLSELYLDDGLKRSWRAGKAQHKGFLEDYAGVVLGLISLYQSDPDPWWFSSAVQILEDMITLFRDPDGLYFDSQSNNSDTIFRPRETQDNAFPSGNALAALALLQLASYDGNSFWQDEADRLFGFVVGYLNRYPLGFGKWLHALNFGLSSITEIAILGNPADSLMKQMIASVWSELRPFSVLASSSYPPPSNSPALLQGRTLVDNRPTAYVCHHMACNLPVNTPQDLLSQL
jgi:uncharacterized protein YyaL (SSP411 family)